MAKTEFTLECSHCGNRTILEVKAELTQKDEIEAWDGALIEIEGYYYLAQCRTCSGVSLFYDWEIDGEPGNLKEAKRLYPKVRDLRGVPKAIHDSYKEAKRVEKHSPTAFAILIRKSLEYLCKEQSAEGKNLKEQIDDLAKKGIIPATLARMASALRYFGNIGAHSSDIKIGAQEARTMDDFFVAVIEYVYIAPEKLEKLKKSLEKSEKDKS